MYKRKRKDILAYNTSLFLLIMFTFLLIPQLFCGSFHIAQCPNKNSSNLGKVFPFPVVSMNEFLERHVSPQVRKKKRNFLMSYNY